MYIYIFILDRIGERERKRELTTKFSTFLSLLFILEPHQLKEKSNQLKNKQQHQQEFRYYMQ